MDALVLLATGGGRGNGGTGAADAAGRGADGGGGDGSAGAVVVEKSARTGKRSDNDHRRYNNEKPTEDPKFRFWPNNRGDNLSKRVKNRTGRGENGTSKLCPRRRGKFQSSNDF